MQQQGELLDPQLTEEMIREVEENNANMGGWTIASLICLKIQQINQYLRDKDINEDEFVLYRTYEQISRNSTYQSMDLLLIQSNRIIPYPEEYREMLANFDIFERPRDVLITHLVHLSNNTYDYSEHYISKRRIRQIKQETNVEQQLNFFRNEGINSYLFFAQTDSQKRKVPYILSISNIIPPYSRNYIDPLKQKQPNNSTISHMLAKNGTIPSVQFHHDPLLRNGERKTVQDLLLENGYTLDQVPAHWRHQIQEQNQAQENNNQRRRGQGDQDNQRGGQNQQNQENFFGCFFDSYSLDVVTDEKTLEMLDTQEQFRH